MSNLVQQRLAALRAAKLAATSGVTNDSIRDERKEASSELLQANPGDSQSLAARSSNERASGNVAGQVPEDVPSRELHVQHESLDVVVLSDQLQPTTMLVVEQPVDDGELSSDDGRPVLEESTELDRSNPVHFNFLSKLKELETALLVRDPQMKTHLAAIHKTMIQYDDIPNLLSAQEIAKIMSAQQVHTNTTLAQTVAKKSSSKKSVTSNLTLDDI